MSIIHQALRQLDILLTHWLMASLDLLGPGAIGCRTRGLILKGLGYGIGKNVKLGTHIYLFCRANPVSIGDHSFINRNATFDANAPIQIGQYCDVGFNVLFTTSSHILESDYQDRRPVYPKGPIIIEDHVWIGSNVTILGNVRIGHGSVVAAGSVVTKDVPPNTLVMGVPAEIAKILDPAIESANAPH